MNKRYFSTPPLDDAAISRALRDRIDFLDPVAMHDFARRIQTGDTASKTPSLGKRYTGSGDYSNVQSDPVVDAFWSQVQLGLSKLNASEVAELQARVAKYSAASGRLNQVGVTHFDRQPDHVADRGQRDMRRIRDETTSEVERINAANRELWDRGGKPAA